MADVGHFVDALAEQGLLARSTRPRHSHSGQSTSPSAESDRLTQEHGVGEALTNTADPGKRTTLVGC